MNDMTPHLTFLRLRGGVPCPMEPPTGPTVLCLGNFDGVHRAHAALLARAREMADGMATEARQKAADGHTVGDTADWTAIKGFDKTADGAVAEATEAQRPLCGVFSFFRPSIDYMNRPGLSGHLTTLREKLRLWAQAGMDFACLCDFPAVRHLSPEAFMELLTDRAHCRGVVCGYDFHFGAGGIGCADTLVARFDCPEEHRRAAVIPMMVCGGQPISSTRIRALLREGNVEEAAELLGRPYALEATVVHGKHLGRELGFPTANQRFPAECMIPAHGVYASLCHTPFGTFPGVSNVGCHPTVDAHAQVNCETYLVGLSHDLYGMRIRVELLKHLRPERVFPDVDALVSAIRQDTAHAEAFVATHLAARDHAT